METRTTAQIVADLRRLDDWLDGCSPATWDVVLEAVDRLTRLEAVEAVLAEDYHPGKGDGWWDGFTELSDRLTAIISP